jgi:hypothetical protein
MRRARLVALGGLASVLAAGPTPTIFHSASRSAPVIERQVIAVYLGTLGTDAESGMVPAIREMKTALTRQATATGREFIARGVSLEPSVDDGLRHLSLFGIFDEVSLGGNWTNSAVVRYLGGTIGGTRATAIPQVILLEREVTRDASRLVVGDEREIGRYIGTKEISTWVRGGAPLPR